MTKKKSMHVGVLLEAPLKNRDRLRLNLDMTVRDEHSNLIVGKVQRSYVRNAVILIAKTDGKSFLKPAYRYTENFIVCEVFCDEKT